MVNSIWALGDYHRFAKQTVWELGPLLVDACGISSGQRVLDVATGTGNVALRAAQRGARVIASDITVDNFEAGRREARALGLDLEWTFGDAENLPFPDASFDAVTSSLGAMFAPRHQAVADELLRVTRPGGTIGMINFTLEGLAADFFGVLGPHLPPAPQPPLLWGSEPHVRELFREASLQLSRRTYVERAESPEAYARLFQETFGPVIAIRSSLPPDEASAFDRLLLDFATRSNRGPARGPAEYPYEILLVVGRKRI